MVFIVIWKTVSSPCCTLVCFVSSFSNSSIFLISSLRSIARDMSLKQISLFLMNFAVANSKWILIGWNIARKILSRQQELLLFLIVSAAMIGTTIANKVHHITYKINSHCTTMVLSDLFLSIKWLTTPWTCQERGMEIYGQEFHGVVNHFIH